MSERRCQGAPAEWPGASHRYSDGCRGGVGAPPIGGGAGLRDVVSPKAKATCVGVATPSLLGCGGLREHATPEAMVCCVGVGAPPIGGGAGCRGACRAEGRGIGAAVWAAGGRQLL